MEIRHYHVGEEIICFGHTYTVTCIELDLEGYVHIYAGSRTIKELEAGGPLRMKRGVFPLADLVEVG